MEKNNINEEVNAKSITCTNIPSDFLDKTTAKEHFSTFGTIKNFSLRPKKFSCSIEYESIEQAANAKQNGNIYGGQRFEIDYTIESSKGLSLEIDPDVQMELVAMRGESILSDTAATGTVFAKKPLVKKTQKSNNLTFEVEQLLKKQAITAEERYHILDSRDKLLRQYKQFEVSAGNCIIGACPDMCPEKERLMREFQYQVSSFEMYPGTNQIDHKYAVKQYSRSSADQETPLPHELRPESVLKMTMAYLLNRIVDLSEDTNTNISDWYHFVWDRMRSIRKDITQQDLCSVESVTLVEQCARFHIHCSARLVEEDPSVFDQKINTENLTKSLQSLKYMYRDLRLENVACPNEAEFRAYVVLLNLNDGNFLWEFKQFENDILSSKELKFALKVYQAIENNNYVRFFELVKETTYLNACLLLRYFTQVRLTAMTRIFKAYSPRNTGTLSLQYIMKLMAFEDIDTTISFLEHYGLVCDYENDLVFLDRGAFYYPEFQIAQKRSFNLVENKRKISVGAVMNGNTLRNLEIFENHKLQNSFNDNGYLTEECINSLFGTSIVDVQPKTDSVFKVPSFRAPSPRQTARKIHDIIAKSRQQYVSTQSVISYDSKNQLESKTDVIDENDTTVTNEPQVKSSILPSANLWSNSFSTINFNFNSTESNLGEKPIFNIIDLKTIQNENELYGSNIIADNSLKLMSEPSLESYSKNFEEADIDSSTGSSTQSSYDDDPELQIVEGSEESDDSNQNKRTARLEEIELSAEVLVTDIINTHIKQQVEDFAFKLLEHQHYLFETLPKCIYYDLLESAIQAILNDISGTELLAEQIIEARRTRNVYKVLRHWISLTRKNICKKKQLQTTPAYIDTFPLAVVANDFKHPNEYTNVVVKKYYLNGESISINNILSTNSTIDIMNMVANEIKLKAPAKRCIYWKTIVSIPDVSEDTNKHFSKQIENYLSVIVGNRNNESASQKCIYLSKKSALDKHRSLAVSLQLMKGSPLNDVNDGQSIKGANGLIYVVDTSSLEITKLRLHALMSLLPVGTMPIAIIVYNCYIDENQVRKILEIDDEINTKFCILAHSPKTAKFKLCFSKALKYIAMNRPCVTYSVEMDSTWSCLSKTIGLEFWYKLQASAEENFGFAITCSNNSSSIITIYNKAVDRLIEVLLTDLKAQPTFPIEFKRFLDVKQPVTYPIGIEYFPSDWIKKRNLPRLLDFLQSLKLSQWTYNQTKEYTSFRGNLKSYIENSVGANIQNIEQLVELATTCIQDYDPQCIPWIHIFRLVSLERLSQTWNTAQNQIPFVVYDKEDLYQLISTPFWLNTSNSSSIGCVKRKIIELDTLSKNIKRNKTEEYTELSDISEVIKKAECAIAKADQKIQQWHDVPKNTKTEDSVNSVFKEAELYFNKNKDLWKKYENKLYGNVKMA